MLPSDVRPADLAANERRVLSLAATGLATAEVAERMRVPPALVHAWLASAIEKLGARSKLDAVIIAYRAGQLDLVHDGACV